MSQLNSQNLFAALAKPSKPKSSTSSKDKKQRKAEKEAEKKAKHAELEQAVFSGPPIMSASNWADDSEEELEAPSNGVEEGWTAARTGFSANRFASHIAEQSSDSEDERPQVSTAQLPWSCLPDLSAVLATFEWLLCEQCSKVLGFDNTPHSILTLISHDDS